MLGKRSGVQPIVEIDQSLSANDRIEKEILVLHLRHSLESHAEWRLALERALDVRAQVDLRDLARERKHQRRMRRDDPRQRIESATERFDDV